MKDLDIDISRHTSGSIDSCINMGIDIVIRVCENTIQVCPTFPIGLDCLHWDIENRFKGWKTNSIK